MILDAHTHLFPPRVRQDPARYATPAEPVYSAMYGTPNARTVDAEGLIRAMDEEGVDRAVTFGFPWSSEDTARMHNDYVLEAQTRYAGRITGLACFDPLKPWAEREAERALDAGLRGLGELAVYTAGFDDPALARLAALGGLCRERDLPLVVHVNEPIGHDYPGKAPLTIREIYALVRALPRTRLVLAHWGGGLFFFQTLKKQVPEALAGVYFDTAASPFLYRPQVYDLAFRILGPDKVLFGSDYPLIKPGRYFREMEEAGLSADALRMIKGDAAAAVFRFDNT